MIKANDKKGPPAGGPAYLTGCKPELLSPAGDMDSLKGAVAAGADAVYLGGDRFTARAYAANFSSDELIGAIEYAHLRGVKIYLTLNTLVKEREYDDVREFISPFYDAGLDAVIVQDIGVMKLIREEFPHLGIHASTQAAVTGKYSSKLLCEAGVSRIVPARELSLKELRAIKEYTGVSIEAFIHGAMCYSYSGMCLFSAMIGGRSGNRGRCGGACRLPYECRTPGDSKKLPPYPLSLRDMCTLPFLRDLILPEDGVPVIDSLKIEGRMKSADYTAGVTDVYRRAIDSIFESPERPYKASEADLDILKGLYLRTDLCGGYYFMHNDSSMVSGASPGYSGKSGQIRDHVEEAFLKKKDKIRVDVFLRARTDEPLTIDIMAAGEDIRGYHAGDTIVSVSADVPAKADKDPADVEKLTAQLDRFGGSDLDPMHFEVDTDGLSFVPSSVLNALRRRACEAAVSVILAAAKAERDERVSSDRRNIAAKDITEAAAALPSADAFDSVSIGTKEQLGLVSSMDELPERVYVPLRYLADDECAGLLEGLAERTHLFAALPYIMREDGYPAKQDIDRIVFGNKTTVTTEGVLARNLEELAYLKTKGYDRTVVADLTVPVWNAAALKVLSGTAQGFTVSPELNIAEIGDLCRRLGGAGSMTGSVMIYGRVPMMVSANCLRKTAGVCRGPGRNGRYITMLTDRKKNTLPVISECRYCYNVLVNAFPTDIGSYREKLIKAGVREFRISLTCENEQETRSVITGKPSGSATSGRIIKGVE